MESAPEKPLVIVDQPDTRARMTDVVIILVICVLIGLVYVPLLHWLGRITWHTQQLVNGAALVLFALAICVRDAMGKLRVSAQISNEGLGLIALAFGCLWLAARWKVLLLPLVLVSACLAFAGIVSFLFGKAGARQFLPALSAFFVFGVLAGLVPTLDWPLRAMAARYAGGLLLALGAPVKLLLIYGQPAQLVLSIQGREFVVATECNGFGLLTSSLIVATTLAFQYRMGWQEKLSLLAISVPIAIVCNFVRIVSICLVAPRTTLPYGFVHETLGLVLYFLGLGLIWKIAGQHKPGASTRAESQHPA